MPPGSIFSLVGMATFAAASINKNGQMPGNVENQFHLASRTARALQGSSSKHSRVTNAINEITVNNKYMVVSTNGQQTAQSNWQSIRPCKSIDRRTSRRPPCARKSAHGGRFSIACLSLLQLRCYANQSMSNWMQI